MDIATLKENFIKIYGHACTLAVRSPGRINIIGEHTDYNEGYVLPAAIDKAIYILLSAREDQQIFLYAQDYQTLYTSALSNLSISDKGWPNYILGVVDQLQKNGYKLRGFNLYIDGDVPLGAGLSSSAAVECAAAMALNQIFDLRIPKMSLALMAQKAEHTFAGVNCGIMDQFASIFGKKHQAIWLDCRSMEYNYVPLDLKGYKWVLFNTNVKHALAESAYNERRKQCEQAVYWIQEVQEGVKSLRDVSIEMLDQLVLPKNEDIYVKCKFVIEENERLVQAVSHLNNGDLPALGKLMDQTHYGLSKQYEVSCKELDFLVDFVQDMPYVLGARMMGGGFGGCTINIVEENQIAELCYAVKHAYFKRFGLELTSFIVSTAEGTAVID